MQGKREKSLGLSDFSVSLFFVLCSELFKMFHFPTRSHHVVIPWSIAMQCLLVNVLFSFYLFSIYTSCTSVAFARLFSFQFLKK